MRRILISLLMMGMFCLYERGNASDKILNLIPKYGHLQLDLRENNLIKEIESDPNYSFGRVLGDIAVDQDGNLFVLDFDRILKYDSHGKYIGTIGKKGEGPGEFKQPNKIFIHEGGDVYISDRGRILHVFRNDGKYVKQIILSFMISIGANCLFIDRDENIYTAMMEMSDTGPNVILVKADPNGNILKKIKVVHDNYTKVTGSYSHGIMGGVIHGYSERLIFSALQNNLLCCGINTKYELFIYDLNGNLKTEFLKKEDATAISAEEKKKLGPDAVFPSNRPFIGDILSDEEGRIYIIRSKSVLDKSPANEIDIFDSNGHYLYRTVVPFKPKLILNGSLYSIEQDENQMRTIKKWEILNYRQLKVNSND
jgi:hypothetical protein